MKAISLNIWGGRAGKENLLAFFKKYRDEVDVFCLQEVWRKEYELHEGVLAGGTPLNNSNIMIQALQEISAVLSEHTPHFSPSFFENYGLCTFVRNNLSILESGDVFVHRERGYIVPKGQDLGTHARNLQYLTFSTPEGTRTVMNFHGLWNGKGKGDSDERLEQSDRIIDFIAKRKEPVVLMGDFNLTPDTESLQKIEGSGLQNLIAEYSITSTRTSLYTKPVKYADYVFVSPDIIVKDFKVLQEEVSDHAALYLDFS